MPVAALALFNGSDWGGALQSVRPLAVTNNHTKLKLRKHLCTRALAMMENRMAQTCNVKHGVDCSGSFWMSQRRSDSHISKLSMQPYLLYDTSSTARFRFAARLHRLRTDQRICNITPLSSPPPDKLCNVCKVKETLTHLLLVCSRYATARSKLVRDLAAHPCNYMQVLSKSLVLEYLPPALCTVRAPLVKAPRARSFLSSHALAALDYTSQFLTAINSTRML